MSVQLYALEMEIGNGGSKITEPVLVFYVAPHLLDLMSAVWEEVRLSLRHWTSACSSQVNSPLICTLPHLSALLPPPPVSQQAQRRTAEDPDTLQALSLSQQPLCRQTPNVLPTASGCLPHPGLHF